MTLSSQNKLLLTFSIFSALICIILGVGLVFFILQSNVIDSLTVHFDKSFSLKTFLTEQNVFYTLIALVIFSIYVPVIGGTVYFTFEKTKSPEILFYIGMLIGFFTESLRLCIPFLSLDNGYTHFLRYICQLIFFGQMFATLSILLQGILATQNITRDADKFFSITAIISLIFAVIIPINLHTIAEFYQPEYGFASTTRFMRLIFIIVTFFAMILSPTNKKVPNYKLFAVSFFFICIGYTTLLETTRLVSLLTGSLFFLLGTFQFLKCIHGYYMWK